MGLGSVGIPRFLAIDFFTAAFSSAARPGAAGAYHTRRFKCSSEAQPQSKVIPRHCVIVATSISRAIGGTISCPPTFNRKAPRTSDDQFECAAGLSHLNPSHFAYPNPISYQPARGGGVVPGCQSVKWSWRNVIAGPSAIPRLCHGL